MASFEHKPLPPFSTGLHIAINAIRDSKATICEPNNLAAAIQEYAAVNINTEVMSSSEQNHCLASLLRDVSIYEGWFAGWQVLAEVVRDCGLHEQLMEDVATCINVYKHVTVLQVPEPEIDIQFTVVPTSQDLNTIGPKGLGGSGWKKDSRYLAMTKDWMAPGFAPVSPTITYDFAGVAKAIVFPPDDVDFRSFQFLGTVDYDFDVNDAHSEGMPYGFRRAAANISRVGDKMQGAAFAGLLMYDQQLLDRSLQLEWVGKGLEGRVVGPSQVSPKDWITYVLTDCGALVPFAYEPRENYGGSQVGMFAACLIANLHDAIYDHGCSSRLNSVMYAAATGFVSRADAFVTGFFDFTAPRVMELSEEEVPLYGDNAILSTIVWSAWIGRYRTWESFIKYSRLLQGSDSEAARQLLAQSRGAAVFPIEGESDVEKAWEDAVDPTSKRQLREREIVPYIITDPECRLQKSYLQLPDNLCAECTHILALILYHERDNVCGIPGLSNHVVSSPGPILAAALRRIAVWATKSICCDVCSCKLGTWIDEMAYKVLVQLMESYKLVTGKYWLMMNYAVGCIELYPARVPSILVGFDAVVNLKFEKGVMGERDVVDDQIGYYQNRCRLW